MTTRRTFVEEKGLYNDKTWYVVYKPTGNIVAAFYRMSQRKYAREHARRLNAERNPR